ncbi:hormogonium polysaccharide secretion pseudopilin HpsB [Cronbergia sp. UHCC 0137]|uniref:hormogonium polysaccharide secretion pseudopilin HpsB n=1 Tax=Cronbergia sp. UHCC 0137 TaxID=3110239 RepID=UPI002B21AE4A|nr:hormogonium polysaccharide secretion pseudopilin HpsB [Cronbergia sp. UHCC 0137]MEA5617082.1 hormogonium polysaccharide secretion pseudopilin HpsB [Cronbergia sp. UHCC 0137]
MIKAKKCGDGDSGFTVIESMMAMVLASLLMIAIAPVLAFSVATRLQTRRVEQANAAAKTFLDAIRGGAVKIEDVAIVKQLAAPTTDEPRNLTATPTDYLISSTDMPAPTTSVGLFCVLKDGTVNKKVDSSSTVCDTNRLFYVQAGRIAQGSGRNDGSRLAIRLYRDDVDFTDTLLASTSTTKKTQTTYTSGIGSKQTPLIEMSTDVAITRINTVITKSSTKFISLCRRLGTVHADGCEF